MHVATTRADPRPPSVAEPVYPRESEPARSGALIARPEDRAGSASLDARVANRHAIRRGAEAYACRTAVSDTRDGAAPDQGDAVAPTTPQRGGGDATSVSEVVSRQAHSADIEGRLPGPLR